MEPVLWAAHLSKGRILCAIYFDKGSLKKNRVKFPNSAM